MPVVIDGNTHMYIMLSQNDSIYDVDVSKYVDIIKYSEGMENKMCIRDSGNLIKWFTNHKNGIPAYIRIDMTTQEAECVRLTEGIKYSKSDHFSRYIYRHLRFARCV